MKSTGAGHLWHRLEFEARCDPVQDGYGNTISGEWELQFEARCGLTYLKGSEAVIASRLEAKSPVVIAIRNSSNARAITHEWRARDTRTGAIYQIKEQPRPSENRSMLEMLAISGIAA